MLSTCGLDRKAAAGVGAGAGAGKMSRIRCSNVAVRATIDRLTTGSIYSSSIDPKKR